MQAGYRLWKQRAICLNEEDCDAAVSLMQNGFSLQDTLDFLCERRNEAIIAAMKEKMEQGEAFPEIFRSVCPKRIRSYFTGFSRFLPFLDSLQIALSMAKAEKQRQEMLVKELFYPGVLLVSCGIGVRLFSVFLLPQLLSMMQEFETETASYELLMHAMNGVFVLLLLLFAALGIGMVLLMDENRLCQFYAWMEKRHPDSLLSCHVSETFCRFYLECVRHKISTRHTLSILRSIPGQPLVAYTAKQLDGMLMEGRNMEDAIASSAAESRLKRIFRLSIYAKDSAVLLEGYLETAALRTKRRLAYLASVVRLLCYGLIAVMAVCIYGMLLMPVSVIQNI